MFAFMISVLKKRSLLSDICKIPSLLALSFVSVVYQCTSPLEFFVGLKAIILPAVKQGWVDRGGRCFWLESETSFSFVFDGAQRQTLDFGIVHPYVLRLANFFES